VYSPPTIFLPAAAGVAAAAAGGCEAAAY